ncbi:MAG TPA: hypothetical protein PLW31_04125 [Bacteroidales bacterium]|nr:hypothetical protein [Bacteroidales bacterium]HPI84878.1 hypothetical protein [Bacteroidales bacterium]
MNTYVEWQKGNIPAIRSNYSETDWNRIVEKQNELILTWIKSESAELINLFNDSYSNSINKDKLLKNTILGIEFIFNIEKKSFTIEEIQQMYKPFNDHERHKLEEAYKKRMVGYRIDPSVIKYSSRDRCYEEVPDLKYAILVDALVKLYDHLKRMLKEDEGISIDNQAIKDIITTKQQLLIIFFLDKYEIFNLKSIHEDMTKQSKILYALINRNEENTYKYFREMLSTKSSREYFTKDNLNAILPFFEAAGMSQIINDIKTRLEKFE